MTLEEFLNTFHGGPPEISLLALGVVLAAGIVASAVCPCTLPVGLGMTGVVASTEHQSRRTGILIATAFFTGIVLNLTLLGALAGHLGMVLTESFGRYWTLLMAVLSLAAAGIAFLGPRLRVSRLADLRRPGLLGALIYGFIFSLGTSAAPLLLLLTFSAVQASALYGAFLAFVFGIGRGLPFLAVGLFAGTMMRFVRIGSWRGTLQMASGGALVLVSLYFFQVFLAFV